MTYITKQSTVMIQRTTSIVSVLPTLLSFLGKEMFIVMLYRCSAGVRLQRSIAIDPIQKMKSSRLRRMGTSLIPHVVKLSYSPISETIANEIPTLNVILSILLMLLFGNNA